MTGKDILQMIYLITTFILFAVAVLTIEFLVKRTKKTDAILTRFENQIERSRYNVILVDAIAVQLILDDESTYNRALPGRKIIYSVRRGRLTGWDWRPRFERFV